MCSCLPWHHPIWKRAGKLAAGAKQGLVIAVYTALRDDPILEPLPVKEKVAVLAEGFGEKPVRVALILVALQHLQLVDEMGCVVVHDEPVTSVMVANADHYNGNDYGNGHGEISTETRRQRELRLNRERVARCRLRKSQAQSEPKLSTITSVMVGAAPLEEERDDLFSLSKTGAHEPERVTKRRALQRRIEPAALLILNQRDRDYFHREMTPERWERFLGHGTGALPQKLKVMVERLIKDTAWRGDKEPQAQPPPQRHLPLPPVALKGGLSDYERTRRLQAIKDDGLRHALEGFGERLREAG